jgi:Trm5-related predicted tRNA methylase
MSQRFRTSARQGENGFVIGRIVSSQTRRRNNWTAKASNLNEMGFAPIRRDPTVKPSKIGLPAGTTG